MTSDLSFNYKQWILLLFLVLTVGLIAAPIRTELEIEDSRLTYYLDFPNEPSAPLMLILEGSFVEQVGPQSILGLHAKLAPPILDLGIGMVMMEKRGVDGKKVDVDLFHRSNTVSQRLKDHMQLIQHLRDHPPQNWNGQLIILGGSEGGPIAIKLADITHPTACIVIAGCGDQAFADYIWSFIKSIPSQDDRLASLPKDRKAYETQIEMMKANPNPTCFWLGQSFLYWSDAMDQTHHQQFLRLRCPVFVVSGTEDTECGSTDRLIAMARERHQDVTYLRLEGAGHKVLDPRWNVMTQVLTWLGTKLIIDPLISTNTSF